MLKKPCPNQGYTSPQKWSFNVKNKYYTLVKYEPSLSPKQTISIHTPHCHSTQYVIDVPFHLYNSMSFLVDATGTQLNIQNPPQRIISLVPSTTHSIYTLGQKNKLVGITRFCSSPASISKSVSKIGGTKDISIEAIQQLQPDIVLANKEENTKEAIEQLRELNIPVYVAYPTTLKQALLDLIDLGSILHAPHLAKAIGLKIQQARRRHAPFRYAYLIWNTPTMSISSNTFISSMLHEIGGINVFEDAQDRYPTIQSIPEDIDALLLSSEPFPFQERHKLGLSQKFSIPMNKIHLIDGAHCSWHGANMLEALSYLHSWREQL